MIGFVGLRRKNPRLMKQLAIRLGWQKALHSHLTKLANYANQVIG